MDPDDTRSYRRKCLLAYYASGGRDCGGADFSQTDLSGVDLRGLDLRRADLSGAILVETDLRAANLSGATLVGADLTNANLEESKGLGVAALAKSSLLGTRLPKELLQSALAAATGASQAVRLPLYSILVACVYFLLALASTEDQFLLTNALDWQMPVIDTKVGVRSFYQYAPFVLFALYVYAHLSLQVLWEELAELPAVFPDGRKLYRVAAPWMVNGMLTPASGGPDPGLTAAAQRYAFILLAWALAPLTVGLAWARYLCVHDPWGTSAQVIALTLCIGFGTFSYGRARLTLDAASHPPNVAHVTTDGRLVARTLPLVAAIALVLAIASHGAIDGFPPNYEDQHWQTDPQFGVVSPGITLRLVEGLCRKTWRADGLRHHATNADCWIRRRIPKLLAAFGWHSSLVLRGAAVTQRPTKKENQCGPTSEIARLDLSHRDLRYATAPDVFLANADLREARMTGANLSGGVLCDTSFVGSDGVPTNLVGVDFRGADLRNVDFERADLTGANFGHADLTGARFFHARIDKADFRDAMIDARCLARATNPNRARLTKAQLAQIRDATRKILKDDLSFESQCRGRRTER